MIETPDPRGLLGESLGAIAAEVDPWARFAASYWVAS
jgi:hypothetical protein